MATCVMLGSLILDPTRRYNMTKAIDILKEEYITEQELAGFLNVDPKRIRDLRSHHVTGKQEFINHIKPTGKCVLYKVDDVVHWLNSLDTCSFGINEKCLEPESVSDMLLKS